MSRSGVPVRDAVPLLEVDPDLGAGLDRESAAAARQLRAEAVEIEPGAWSPPEQPGPALGLLLVDGVLGRDVVLGGIGCSELLAPGDLLLPAESDGASVPMAMEWWAVERATVAILDGRFAARAHDCPPVIAGLVRRSVRQSQSSAMHLAITCLTGVGLRLHVLFWHLADRFGRMGPEGAVVHLPLRHELLGRLVRARRPAVTLALGELRERDRVVRRDDGAWLLRGGPPTEVLQDGESHDSRSLD